MATASFTSTTRTIRYKTDMGPVVATLLPSLNLHDMLFSALVDGEMFTSTQPAQYKALQAMAKAHGVKASGKCNTIRHELHTQLAHEARNGVAPVMPKTKAQRRAALTSTPTPTEVATVDDVDMAALCFECESADHYECPEVAPEAPEAPEAPKARMKYNTLMAAARTIRIIRYALDVVRILLTLIVALLYVIDAMHNILQRWVDNTVDDALAVPPQPLLTGFTPKALLNPTALVQDTRTRIDYSKLNVKELRRIARNYGGIKGVSKMRRHELIKALA